MILIKHLLSKMVDGKLFSIVCSLNIAGLGPKNDNNHLVKLTLKILLKLHLKKTSA